MTTAQKNEIYIFDANIFLRGIDFNVIEGQIYTTQSIINEIEVERYKEKNRNILSKIIAARESKKLLIKSPSSKYIQEIKNESKNTGDYKALSEPDIELLALALELKNTLNKNILLYTNDYSMENVCSSLGIPFSPLMRAGIKSRIRWEIFCPFCKDIRKASEFNTICDTCGLKIKRRPKK